MNSIQKCQIVLYKIIMEILDYWKLCKCWVSKMLTDNHKNNRVAAVQAFLAHYKEQGDNFLDNKRNMNISPYI